MDADGLKLEVLINANDTVHVNRREFYIVMNQNGQATTTTSRSIAAEERVARKRWVRHMRAEFSFLYTGYLHVVLVKESGELSP